MPNRPGCVDDDDVEVLGFGLSQTACGDSDRIPGRSHWVARVGAVRDGARTPHTCALADDLELVDGSGRCRSHATSSQVLPLAAQPLGELARQRRLAGALQAGSMITVGGFFANDSWRVSPRGCRSVRR